jgi:short-subunit dehydrogenase
MAGPHTEKPEINRTVLITGATSGLGTYLAHAFARAGYVVVLHGRDEAKLRAIKNQVLDKNRISCATVVGDLLDAKGLSAVLSAMRTQDIDILVNNAGIDPELTSGGVKGDIKDINAIFSTNATSAIALCYGAFEHFLTKGGGDIVNMNSVAGMRGSDHEPLYAASKFGLRGFSESVKEAWLKQGIRMTDIYSGAIATGMASHRPDVKDLIDPQELAEFIVGLCAPDSFFVREISVQKTKKKPESGK